MTGLPTNLNRPEFPRSNNYDPAWMLENQMGPNAVWLMEWLAGSLALKPGMRVLDLGCGRAATSIFLAREFNVQVWATDLWIGPEHNACRAAEAGVGDRVFPIHAEAHALPFAPEFFDAIVSVDAYQYFGTDVLYLAYLTRFLRPEGPLGVVMPGLMQDFDTVPQHLLEPQSNGKVFWEVGCWTFKTAAWWHEHWSRAGCVAGIQVDTLPDGWRHWRDFERAVEAAGTGIFPSDAETLDRDAGRYLGFVRAIASRCGALDMNLYDPALGAAVGVDT